MAKDKSPDLEKALTKPKDIDQILTEQIDTALSEHRRSKMELFISAVSAGLEIGFSIFLMGTLYTLYSGRISGSDMHLLMSVAYPLGFIFVVIGRSVLFTEHTTLAVIPVLNRNATIKSLLILWGVVYLGNILGGYLFSLLLVELPVKMGIITTSALIEMASKMVNYPWGVILGSGILAGWLMGLLSWLVTSAQDSISRFFSVIMVTTVIGIGSLHHSIVGSIEVFTGVLLSDSITWGDYLLTQWWSTAGNLIGGVVFVALLKFSHVNMTKTIK